MSLFRVLALCGVAVGAAGCSIHPLPNDVTGLSTAQIVRQIRCELREALVDEILEFVDRRGNESDRAFVKEIRAGRRSIVNFPRHMLSEPVQRTIGRFISGKGGAAVLDFEFVIEEQNNTSSGLEFLGAFTGGSATLGFSVESRLQRTTTRSFSTADKFEDLVNNKELEHHCNTPTKGPDWVYPISGRIELQEVLHTFFVLANQENLYSATEAPTLKDTLDFITHFRGSVNAGIELEAVPRGFTLRRATFGTAFGNDKSGRKDQHKVLVSLALPANSTAGTQGSR